MKQYNLIYLIKDKKDLEKKFINYIEMTVLSEDEFSNLTDKSSYEVSVKIKSKNKKEAKKYFINLYKTAEDIKIK